MQGGRSRRLCIAAAELAVAVADAPVFTCQMVLSSLNYDGVDGTKLRECRVPTV